MKGTMKKRVSIVRTISAFLLIVAVMFGMIASTPKNVSAGNDQHIGEYKIVLNYNGASAGKVEKWIAAGVKYALPSASRSGYRFNGWTYAGKKYSSGYTFYVSQSMTFTASWTLTCNHPSTSVTTKVIKAPTCTQGGTYARVCNTCGKELTRYSVDKLGHNYKINDDGTNVSVVCNRCGHINSSVKTLREFAKYYKGQGHEYSYYSKSIQNEIAGCWIRYNNAGLKMTKAQALKLVEKSSSTTGFSDVDISDYNKAAEYLYCIDKLSKLSYVEDGLLWDTTVYPFQSLAQLNGTIVGNGYTGFLALDKDVRNAPEYQVITKFIDLVSKVPGFSAASYAKKIIEQYAKITNVAIALAYKGADPVSKTGIRATCDGVSFKELVDNIDYYYSECVAIDGKEYPFGTKYRYEINHNNFIKYILYRAQEEYKQIFT